MVTVRKCVAESKGHCQKMCGRDQRSMWLSA